MKRVWFGLSPSEKVIDRLFLTSRVGIYETTEDLYPSFGPLGTQQVQFFLRGKHDWETPKSLLNPETQSYSLPDDPSHVHTQTTQDLASLGDFLDRIPSQPISSGRELPVFSTSNMPSPYHVLSLQRQGGPGEESGVRVLLEFAQHLIAHK